METALIFVKDHMPMFRDSDAWGRSLKYRQVASAMRTEDRKDAPFIQTARSLENCHMVNSRYVNPMENSFSSEVYEERSLKEMELHYVVQSFDDDEIRLYRKSMGDSRWLFAGDKTDGTVVMTDIMIFRR